MENLYDVINYMIYQGKGHFSPKQINRFLYYSYALYLVKYNDFLDANSNRLFNADFKAYLRGPVIDDANNYLEANRGKYFSYDDASAKNIEELQYTEEALKDRSKNFINKILLVFGKYTGNELENITKNEYPYKKIYTEKYNKVIPEELIFDYYASEFKEDYQKPKKFIFGKKPKMI